jgi:hypothetical protein
MINNLEPSINCPFEPCMINNLGTVKTHVKYRGMFRIFQCYGTQSFPGESGLNMKTAAVALDEYRAKFEKFIHLWRGSGAATLTYWS